MSKKVKEIDIKNRTYYFFNDMINIKTFDPNNIKLGEKPYKNILLYFDNQRFEIRKYLYCKSFVTYFQQSGWIL